MTAKSRRKRNKKPTKLAVGGVKGGIKVRLTTQIDARSTVARAMEAWKAEVVRDKGGKESLSAAQHALIETAALTKLYVASIDAYLVSLPTGIINRKKRSAIPLLAVRMQLENSLARSLDRLGLQKAEPSLATILAGINSTTATPSDDSHLPPLPGDSDEPLETPASEESA